MPRKKKPETAKQARRGVGQPRKYGSEICRSKSFSLPESLLARLEQVAPKHGQSAIVAAGLRSILSQSPDRLKDAVAGR